MAVEMMRIGMMDILVSQRELSQREKTTRRQQQQDHVEEELNCKRSYYNKLQPVRLLHREHNHQGMTMQKGLHILVAGSFAVVVVVVADIHTWA